jgi:proteic killer suppression protein
VILSYGDRRTAAFARGERNKAFEAIEWQARMKLDRLEAATALGDLAALPGNRLEALKRERKGQWSIRINDRWRVCFAWSEGERGPSEVEIVDYH